MRMGSQVRSSALSKSRSQARTSHETAPQSRPDHTLHLFNRCSGASPSFPAQSITIGPGLCGILAINAQGRCSAGVCYSREASTLCRFVHDGYRYVRLSRKGYRYVRLSRKEKYPFVHRYKGRQCRTVRASCAVRALESRASRSSQEMCASRSFRRNSISTPNRPSLTQ